MLAVLLIPTMTDAQQRGAARAEKKKEKTEREYKKGYARARRLTLKHRREIQTETTKKRMDEAYKRAETFNKQGDPGFLDRLFKKKRHKKR